MNAHESPSKHEPNDNSGLLAGLQERNQRLKILSDTAGLLLLTDNPREVIDTVFDMLSAHLGLEAYFNYMLVEDDSRMRLANYRGIPPETAKEIEWLDFGQAVCGCVARDKARVIAEDVQHSDDERTKLIRSLGITAYCCHPLIARDKLIGTLSFGTRKRQAFSDDEIDLLHIACNQVAIALERHDLIVQLQKSRDQLEQKIARRTGDLSKANAALSKTNEALRSEISERVRAEAGERKAKYEADLYLDLMGHDINNMHQMAMSSVELAMETANIAGEERELLENSVAILKKSARMIDLVRNLHAIESGEIKSEEIDLRDTLDRVIADFENIYDKNITASIPDRACPVQANVLLREVFSSLISNAVKHSNRDDVAISVSLETVEDAGRSCYQVAVEDNGQGIPDVRKADILSRFSAGDANTKGIGMGLYIVRSLVDSYHGHVRVEDRVPGDHTKGARFVVLLPAISE